MRSICTLIVGLILLSVGCNNNSLVKREYLPLEELKKQNKFLGYEIAIGPGLVEPWAPGDKKEDRKVNTGPMEMTGPFMITDDIVGGVIENESGTGIYGNYLHRLVTIDGKCYEFRIDENADGYGYRLVSVRNKAGELGIFFLKSKTRKKNTGDGGAAKGKSKKGKSKKGKSKNADGKKGDAEKADAKKDDAEKADAKKDDAEKADAKKDDEKSDSDNG